MAQVVPLVAMTWLGTAWLGPSSPALLWGAIITLGVISGVLPWQRGWTQSSRAIGVVGGALVAMAFGGGPAFPSLAVYLASAVAAVLTIRVRSPLVPALPSLVFLCSGAIIAPPMVDTSLEAAAFAACTLLYGMQRQLASDPRATLHVDRVLGDVDARRRRPALRGVPLACAVAIVGLVTSALLPFSDADARSQLDRLVAGTPLNPVGPGVTGRVLPYDRSHRPRPSSTSLDLSEEPVAEVSRDEADGLGDAEHWARYLRSEITTTTDRPSGELMVTRLLDVLASRRGTPRQKAALLVITARYAGHRARLAHGYVVVPRFAAGQRARASYAHTWPEVYTAGRGWVAVHTTDLSFVRSTQSPVVMRAPANPRWSLWSWRLAPSIDATHLSSLRSLGLRLLIIAIVCSLVTGAVLVPAVAALRQAQRSKRATSGAGAKRISGAWHEVTDLLRQLGAMVSPALTPAQVVAAASPVVGAPTSVLIARLAELADQACFAPQAPDQTAASEAWALVRATRLLLLRDRNVVRRLTLAMDPRPLWWDRQRKPAHTRR